MTDEKKPNVNDEMLDIDDFVDETDGEPEDEETTGEENKEKGKNSYYAQKRREQEAKEKDAERQKIERDAYNKGKLDAIKVNRFTDEPIEDEYDLNIYEIQVELEKDGKDPINDLAKELAKRRRAEKTAQLEKEKTEVEQKNKINQEIAEFVKEYPDVNTKELSEDKDYQEYSKDKLGRWTLGEIYEGYLRIKQAKDNDAMEQTAKNIATKRSKVPSSNPISQPAVKKSVKDMTDEEFKEYWNKKYER